MLTRRFLLSFATAAALALPAAAQDRLSVVATTGMIADAARQVGGERVDVTALMGPGVDPHAYRQTRSDIVTTAQADLVFWNGLYLEAQLEPFLLELAAERAVVAVAEAIPSSQLIGSEDYEGRFDPHVWMNPNLWSRVVLATRDAMIAADPDNAETYTANAATHLEELAALAVYSQTVLASIPAEARVLVTAHDAFTYFGAAYGFEVMGIQGISTESEAGLNRISELVDTLVTRNIGAVFVETSVSDRNIRALIEGAAAQGHTVSIGGELFSDAMGAPGTYEGTYLGMIDHNVTTIARALGGQAPERGRIDELALN
ncbi:metal ABC transporter solute-binding protein, Zn/Mn family [Roseicyclus mahoneyensis]|uniref:Manganese/zinc/iron transport system substrate-binding protein n=1 Tax=Roseicyclus mahoneyensis TaxID=164332 RepID=A0A316GNS5_9RHOB|nr:zinc ABC transporter substrate-binding protein [Roseicyclus mahoneyensis]PWK62308.1 manganese/zinc/iron transport system substrate-binding protein [Roseicyclus mahoneyensis]